MHVTGLGSSSSTLKMPGNLHAYEKCRVVNRNLQAMQTPERRAGLPSQQPHVTVMVQRTEQNAQIKLNCFSCPGHQDRTESNCAPLSKLFDFGGFEKASNSTAQG